MEGTTVTTVTGLNGNTIILIMIMVDLLKGPNISDCIYYFNLLGKSLILLLE